MAKNFTKTKIARQDIVKTGNKYIAKTGRKNITKTSQKSYCQNWKGRVEPRAEMGQLARNWSCLGLNFAQFVKYIFS